MKKFSVILLAMAIAAFFAAPAMAVHVGDVGTGSTDLAIQGKYNLDGEYHNVKWKDPGIINPLDSTDPLNGVKDIGNTFMDDDFELVITATMGDVTGVVDLEIKDGLFAGHDLASARPFDIVDNFWVTWKFHDNWNFKAGEYAVSLGRKFAVYNMGGHNIRLDWNLEGLNLVGIYGKVEDGVWQDGDSIKEADQNQIFIGAEVKAISFFSKLDFWLAYQNLMQTSDTAPDDKDYGTGLFMVDYGIPFGNWHVNGEIGSFFGDNTPTRDSAGDSIPGTPIEESAKGLYNITELGVDLNTIALEGVLLYTDKHFQAAQDVQSRFSDDYAPMEWFLDEFNGFGRNVTAIWFTLDWTVNDRLSVGGLIMPFADMTSELTVGSVTLPKESYGTEVDLNLSYKLADNVNYNLNFGYFTGGDAFQGTGTKQGGVDYVGSIDNAMVLWNRISFTF